MSPRTLARKVFGLDKRARPTHLVFRDAIDAPTSLVAPDFVASPHRRGPTRAWRWTAWGALMLFACIGFIAGVVRPVVQATRTDAPPAATDAIDVAAARALAAGYAADYFSYDSGSPGTRTAALTRWTGQAPNSTANWSGTGQIRADVVLPGAVQTRDGGAVVAVTARVTAAVLAEGADAPAATDTTDVAVAADPGPAVAPWTPVDPVWLVLHVPVLDDGGTLVVAPGGGSLVAGDPTTVVRDDQATDGPLASDTDDLPDTVFAALADGATGYLTAPGYDLPGLGGAVTLAGVSGWTVADGDDSRWASADVSWTLLGTTLTITQPYALTITDDQGRWLVSALDTPTEENP